MTSEKRTSLPPMVNETKSTAWPAGRICCSSRICGAWPLCGPRKPTVARAPPQARWMKVTEVFSSAFSSARAAIACPERPVRVQWTWS